MKRIKSVIALLSLCFIISCATTQDPIAREVERDTREKRKYPIIMSAQGMGYTLNLRDQNFFDFQGRGPDESGSSLYAGTYERKGDSLLLGFHNNYKPMDLTGTGMINRTNNTVTLFSKDPSKHRMLTIQTL